LPLSLFSLPVWISPLYTLPPTVVFYWIFRSLPDLGPRWAEYSSSSVIKILLIWILPLLLSSSPLS
jgi:hypothetical protein